jgi:hypothetical protein
MCEREDFSNRVIEMRIIHSIPIISLLPFKLDDNQSSFRRIDILADLRGVFYSHKDWSGKSWFIDPFFALRKRFTNSSWCMAGVGLNPFIFDKWHYSIVCDGREKFIEGRDIFRKSAFLNQSELLEALRNAEEEISTRWMISFEANLDF